MKRLLIPLVTILLFSCSGKNSPLEGSWNCIGENDDFAKSCDDFHSYTFDGYIGFGIERHKPEVSQFGKIVYTSDTTAIMTYTNGRKRNIRIEWYDEKACAIWEGKEMITTLMMYSGPKEYREYEHANAFRALVHAKTCK